MRVGKVWGSLRQGYLDRGWAPGDELGEIALADPKEGFVDLRGRRALVVFETGRIQSAEQTRGLQRGGTYFRRICFALDDVEIADVTT